MNVSGFLTLLLMGAVYFLPTVIAACRGHHNAPAIFALNLLLGWTLLGWVVAAVWALTAVMSPGIPQNDRSAGRSNT